MDLTPITGLALVGSEGVEDGGRGGGKSRQDHSKSDTTKRSKFGNYILGQTLGEGEFGKVKMGWKRDSSVEVAIKLIRRETLGGNANRLQKIYREIHILRGLDHPNIVRLHEMVETERHIGIILEYASGGELFDYILNHRYLKDGPARKLFSQLISGVGYLHKKGIVHRDLKLENLLLDRNKNIIITDFGFANTFDAKDELSEEIEYRLGDKDYIRSLGLEGTDGARRGDLMQTSCGSPCYAAPELVVSDSLYTGRKVDVWSCGVILVSQFIVLCMFKTNHAQYAMLAGYLPFDDDPANPEGDNINLLYKYIVSTPLTFPDYVTPHAKDLLRRILVPDPRKRADLFEVARHSWLADYSHVVGFITSSNNPPADGEAYVYASTSQSEIRMFDLTLILLEDTFEQPPPLARSASVREPGKPHTATAPTHGGLTAKREQINQPASEKAKTSRDNKRRTVQVEYVAPQSQTIRGEASSPAETTPKARSKDVQAVADGYQSSATKPPRSAGATATAAQARSGRDQATFSTVPATSTARPGTGGSRLPSRGNSYGQPSAATVAQTNAEGRFAQPKGQQYTISPPFPPGSAGAAEASIGLPSTQRGNSFQLGPSGANAKSHKRSSTVTETLGRMTSMFSGRSSSHNQDPRDSQTSHANYPEEKKQKSYPPTSMPGPMANDGISGRQSTESSRRTSFGFSRKNTNNSGETGRSSRRFSLLPSSLSKTFSSQRDSMSASSSYRDRQGSLARPRAGSRPGMSFGRPADSRTPSQSTTTSNNPGFYDAPYDGRSRNANTVTAGPASAPAAQTQFDRYHTAAPLVGDEKFPNPMDRHPSSQNRLHTQGTMDSEAEGGNQIPPTSSQQQHNPYPAGMGGDESSPQRKGVLQKHRKFADAYDEQSGNKGSSGSSKKVMDFFRRVGKQRMGGR